MGSTQFVQDSNAYSKPFASPLGGLLWNQLQQLREEVIQELLNEAPLCQSEPDDNRDGPAAAADTRDIEWRHRSQLEANLRDITDAQDRLLDGNYGICIDCGKQISTARLGADPVASLCLSCQRISERETIFPTL